MFGVEHAWSEPWWGSVGHDPVVCKSVYHRGYVAKPRFDLFASKGCLSLLSKLELCDTDVASSERMEIPFLE
jgi:hypothetical protein